MPRRKQLPPDTRPDWRDPNMPVFRTVNFTDGSKKDMYIDHNLEHQMAKGRVVWIEQQGYDVHRDPTYELKKVYTGERKQIR